jgi:hypothetical protein
MSHVEKNLSKKEKSWNEWIMSGQIWGHPKEI